MDEKARIAKAEELLLEEKKARVAGENDECARIVVQIIRMFYDAKDWTNLCNYIAICSRRRGQIKKAQSAIVAEGMKFIEEVQDKDVKLKLINVYRDVTAGKIFLELESARLTKLLSSIKEAEGNLVEAAALLHEVQIETYGSMEQKEKANYLLDQMRLALVNKDFVRVQIQAQKVNMKTLAKEDFQDERVRFHRLMIAYHEHLREFKEVAQSYMHIYHTPMVQADRVKSMETLTLAVYFCLLAPYDSDVSDMSARLLDTPQLQDNLNLLALLRLFITNELIGLDEVSGRCRQVEVLKTQSGTELMYAQDMKARVVEHNIRVLGMYYDSLSVARLEELLTLRYDELEQYITRMVNSKVIYCRIDRPAGVVAFSQKLKSAQLLNTWSGRVDELLDLVEKTTCDIAKERMIKTVA